MSTKAVAETTSRPYNNTQLLEHPSSLKDLVDKIASLKAEDIEYLAKKISSSAISGLGVVGKAYVAQQSMLAMSEVINKVLKRQLPALGGKEWLDLSSRIKWAQNDIQYINDNHTRLKQQFLNYTQTYTLWAVAIEVFQKGITASFSTPLDFITKGGVYFQISNIEQPVEAVKNIANRAGIDLTESGRNYYVRLEVDAILTRDRSELVFAAIQEGYGIIFNRSTFTLAELKTEFP